MGKITSAERWCEVCGNPIQKDNRLGVCARTPKCRSARVRLTRGTTRPPEQKPCSVCGRPIRSDNELGICQRVDSPECKAARWRKLQEMGPLGKVRYCEVCGRKIRRDNSTGVCDGRGSPECERERDRRRRGAAPSRPEDWTPAPYIAAGAVYGRLTVLEDVHASTDPVLCDCECGGRGKQIGRAVYLTCGRTRSCGCLRRELMSTHGGLTKHPLYKTWYGIIQRTTNPENDAYINYGGRGVGVSERWLDLGAFIEDIEREIGPRPEGVTDAGWPLYSLDRVDVDGNYEPGNVKWSTASEQLLNRRRVPDLAAQIAALTAQLQTLTERAQEPRKRTAPAPAAETATLF